MRGFPLFIGSAPALLCGILLLAAVPTVRSADQVTTYQNPTGPAVADPFVLKDGASYYLYGTGPTGRGFEVYESKDLVRWENGGFCFEKTDATWSQEDFWAPEVFRNGADYYLYYTARHGGAMRNACVAKSQSPLGPFKEIKAPMFPEISCIDPHAYRDPVSGEVYFYVTQEPKMPGRILVTTLKENMTDAKTSLTECLAPTQPWEDYWVEGAAVIRHGDYYYMTYSGGSWSEATYSIGYAFAKHPAGPWEKYSGNPILHNTEFTDGPGHNSLVESPDGKELFMVYHQHRSQWTTSREVAMDRVAWSKPRGGPAVMSLPDGPSHTKQKLPSGSSPWKAARTDKFDGPTLDTSVWSIFNEDKENWRLDKGDLVIQSTDGDFWQRRRDGVNLFLQDLADESYSVRTKLTFDAQGGHEQASLVLWQDMDNYLMLESAFVHVPRFEVALEQLGKVSVSLRPNEIGKIAWLRMDVNGKRVRCYVSGDGSQWKEIVEPFTIRFDPRKVGIGAWSPGREGKGEARFSEFVFQEKK